VVLSGGHSVFDSDAQVLADAVLEFGVAALRFRDGAQPLAHRFGGRVAPAARREFGRVSVRIGAASPLCAGVTAEAPAWMRPGLAVRPSRL
jgi:GMP synthase (glutamine-hydrolysing)